MALACTLGLGALGAWLWQEGRLVATSAAPEATEGYVSLVTDDPRATVDIRQHVFEEPAVDGAHPLHLTLRVGVTGRRRVAWALVLSGDAALPDGAPAGDLPTRADRPADSPSATGSVDRAEYVRRADTLLPEPSSVVVGESSVDANGDASFEVIAPVRGSIVQDRGDEYTIDPPVLGPPYAGDTPRDTLAQLVSARARGAKVKIFQEGNPPREVQRRVARGWRLPRRYRLSVEVRHSDSPDRLLTATPEPASPSSWYWNRSDRLEVLATVERPDERASRQRFQFLAGIALGVAGGFLVWLLELAREWARSGTRDLP